MLQQLAVVHDKHATSGLAAINLYIPKFYSLSIQCVIKEFAIKETTVIVYKLIKILTNVYSTLL